MDKKQADDKRTFARKKAVRLTAEELKQVAGGVWTPRTQTYEEWN